MKYANDIIAEIKEREPIENVMCDEQWENYMRGERIMKTNFDLVKDRSVVMDGTDMTMPYKIFPTVKDFVDFLNLPVEEKILDDDEKRYLKNIVRPFKDKVACICKRQYNKIYEYIVIIYQDTYIDADGIERNIYLPNFKKDTMYKGMSLDKDYTLAELGITFKN